MPFRYQNMSVRLWHWKNNVFWFHGFLRKCERAPNSHQEHIRSRPKLHRIHYSSRGKCEDLVFWKLAWDSCQTITYSFLHVWSIRTYVSNVDLCMFWTFYDFHENRLSLKMRSAWSPEQYFWLAHTSAPFEMLLWPTTVCTTLTLVRRSCRDSL